MTRSPAGLHVTMRDRDLNLIRVPDGLEFTVNRYSFSTQGGPKECSITAYGTLDELWGLTQKLRYYFTIHDENGLYIWYGILNEVTVRVGTITFGVSLDGMYNRVSVAYTSFGDRRTTSWATDTPSTEEYGYKELLATLADGTDQEAEQYRDSQLQKQKVPVPHVEFLAQSKEGSMSADMKLIGIYETLDWRYYSQAKGLVQHSGTGVGYQPVGIIVSSACVDFIEDTHKIDNWGELLTGYQKGNRVSVYGSSNNDGTYVLTQGTSSGCSLTVEEDLTDETGVNNVRIVSASRIAQGFKQTSGSSWDAIEVQIRAQIVGSPTDDLQVSLHTNDTGSPFLATAPTFMARSYAFFAASDMDETMQWRSASWTTGRSGSVTLVDGQDYWLVVTRTASAPGSASDHYRVDVDESLGYISGSFAELTSDGWVERTTNADMLFKLIGTQPVTDQIYETAYDSSLLFERIVIADESAVETNQYREGDTTALTEIRDLLEVGTENDLRLFARATEKRSLIIEEEPAKGDNDYRISYDNTIYDAENNIIPKYMCPYGVWMNIADFVPESINTEFIANPNYFFVEEAEYYVQSDVYVPRSKNQKSDFDLSGFGSG